MQAASAPRHSVAAITIALSAAPAFAHPGEHHAAASFALGFLHPVVGWDHLLAMLAVGLWAAQQPRRIAWLMPLAFPAMMALGAAAGVHGAVLPWMEIGIAASVAVLGLLIAFAVRMPMAAGAAIIGLFGLMHGYAHGIEAPAGGAMLGYGAGFIAATAILHLIGLLAGSWATRQAEGRMLRGSGALLASAGVSLLAFI
ncbi:HupE/UreJ family protein [Noviherbaspirillum aerium]|uniref:HupE/UreJ family protein n=1 Tax=Noviherbaspirillum aerium TaxID=2588497 RepID=UPI00124E178B|nr:HupE/UreJ family protein [Noviherbaspirillum aerium]